MRAIGLMVVLLGAASSALGGQPWDSLGTAAPNLGCTDCGSPGMGCGQYRGFLTPGCCEFPPSWRDHVWDGYCQRHCATRIRPICRPGTLPSQGDCCVAEVSGAAVAPSRPLFELFRWSQPAAQYDAGCAGCNSQPATGN